MLCLHPSDWNIFYTLAALIKSLHPQSFGPHLFIFQGSINSTYSRREQGRILWTQNPWLILKLNWCTPLISHLLFFPTGCSPPLLPGLIFLFPPPSITPFSAPVCLWSAQIFFYKSLSDSLLPLIPSLPCLLLLFSATPLWPRSFAIALDIVWQIDFLASSLEALLDRDTVGLTDRNTDRYRYSWIDRHRYSWIETDIYKYSWTDRQR